MASEIGLKEKLRLFKAALRIRMVENAVADAHLNFEIRTPTHLYHGQENIAVAACSFLTDADQLFAYYRSHGWYLAKGGNLKAMLAELFAKSTGCSRGYGGSMHLIDLKVGSQGTTSTVGGGIPHAVGAAFGIKYLRRDAIAVSCFGDGATEEGVFQESLMFSALKNLPIVFICENNGLACEIKIEDRQPPVSIWQRAGSLGVPSVCVDGRDVEALCAAMKEAVSHARSGRGPFFIECMTRRFAAHCEIPGVSSRHAVHCMVENDPLMDMTGWATEEERIAATEELRAEIAEAFDFARTSPFPADLQPRTKPAGEQVYVQA